MGYLTFPMRGLFTGNLWLDIVLCMCIYYRHHREVWEPRARTASPLGRPPKGRDA